MKSKVKHLIAQYILIPLAFTLSFMFSYINHYSIEKGLESGASLVVTYIMIGFPIAWVSKIFLLILYKRKMNSLTHGSFFKKIMPQIFLFLFDILLFSCCAYFLYEKHKNNIDIPKVMLSIIIGISVCILIVTIFFVLYKVIKSIKKRLFPRHPTKVKKK